MGVSVSGSYLLMQIAVLLTIYMFTFDTADLRVLTSKRFLVRTGFLSLAWLGVEQLGVALGIWYYPGLGTLPVRLFGLPVEEYVMLFTHAVLCQMLVTHALRQERGR